MARSLFFPVLLLACAACKKSDADAKPEDPPAEEKKLAVGSPAPPLAVAKWVKGDPVPAFEPGKVYVVEFWATWCGPCLSAMPHLSELAKEHKAQGLTVIAVTTADERGNSPEAVAKFAAGRGKDYAFAVALCDTPATQEAFMDASGTTGFPSTFVVDRAGKVAFIGRPDDLDEVLPKVLAGTWKGAADALALKQQEAEVDDILAKVQEAEELARLTVGRNPDRAAAAAFINRQIAQAAGTAAGALDKYAARYPGRAAKPTFQLTKVRVLLWADKFDEARTASEAVLARAAGQRNPDLLRLLVDLWADRGMNPARKYPELPVRAADEVLKLEGEGSVPALLAAAQAYHFAGSREKGREYGEKAVALVTDLRQRRAVQEALRSFED
jgi:thiol-disulfide isomerase/thioredoxin